MVSVVKRVWSDIPNNRQLRWIEDDDRVTEFRNPSGNSNGNTLIFKVDTFVSMVIVAWHGMNMTEQLQ